MYPFDYTYEWVLNSNGLPEQFTSTENGWPSDPIIFKW